MTTRKIASPLDDEEFLALFGYKAPMDAVSLVDRDPEVVASLKELFGEAGHLFECHADGTWAGPEGHKDRLALRLCEILRTRPNLAHRLIKTDNRVVKMITYRALEISKAT
jgi:hypothetical protein